MLCISKAIFEKLTLAAREFIVKTVCPKQPPTPVQPSEPSFKPLELQLHNNKNTEYLEYTPTPIWYTRDSRFWQWQRVSEWHREYGQDEITNEKRHILV